MLSLWTTIIVLENCDTKMTKVSDAGSFDGAKCLERGSRLLNDPRTP